MVPHQRFPVFLVIWSVGDRGPLLDVLDKFRVSWFYLVPWILLLPYSDGLTNFDISDTVILANVGLLAKPVWDLYRSLVSRRDT